MRLLERVLSTKQNLYGRICAGIGPLGDLLTRRYPLPPRGESFSTRPRLTMQNSRPNFPVPRPDLNWGPL